jgi:preprotein translocase subunit YajC
MDLISPALAQTASAAGPGGLNPMFVMVPIIIGFYFLIIRPQQKRIKEQQAMLAKLASGDEVVTSGGLLGRITEVGDTYVTLEIADGVRIKVQRGQISQLVPKGTLKSA